tara:strand:- start:2779 stop:3648 length:870 start_codon:yes stop_codon:yes gene_type:complete
MYKNEIFFSIIIPTFNREKSLLRAVDSVINQTFDRWELIIIDNFSNDNTEHVIKELKSNKINFYQIKNDGVIAKSRNFGIKKSKGKFLSFLDSDDWWETCKLESVHKKALVGYDFIYHNHRIYNPKKLYKTRNIRTFHYKKPIYQNLIDQGPSFATSSVTLNKNTFKKINFFNEDKNYIAWEDWDAWIQFSKHSEKFIRLKKNLSTITQDGSNMLNDSLRIKNNSLFINKYLEVSKTIPNWCIYSNLISSYNLSIVDKVKKNLKVLNFSKLNILQKIRYLQIYIHYLLK